MNVHILFGPTDDDEAGYAGMIFGVFPSHQLAVAERGRLIDESLADVDIYPDDEEYQEASRAAVLDYEIVKKKVTGF